MKFPPTTKKENLGDPEEENTSANDTSKSKRKFCLTATIDYKKI